MATKVEQKEASEKWLSLRAFHIANRIGLPRLAAENLKVVEEQLEHGIYGIRTWVLANTHPAIPHAEELTVEVPATWWQHFKLRWFSSRLLKRFPVVYDVHTKRVEWTEGPIYVCPHHFKRHQDPDHLRFLLREGKKEDDE